MTTFKRIKKGLLADAILKAVLWGVAVSGGAIGALMLSCKLLGSNILSYVFIAAGAGGFVLAAALAFALTYKSDKRLAGYLDTQFSLREKVLTMIEFEGDDNPMVKLQREQTEQILSTLPYKKPFYKRFLVTLIALVLGVGLLISGIAIPKKQPAESYVPDLPFEISAWQMGALGALIDEVRYSEIEENVKDELVVELERLRDVLKGTTTKSKMTDEVVASIVAADLIVEGACSYKKICVALDGGENMSLKKMAAAIITLNGIGFGDKLASIREEISGEQVKDTLTQMSAEADKLLGESGVDDGDGLLAALRKFTDGLGDIGQSAEEDESIIDSLIDKEFSDASDAIGTQLSAQYRKRAVRDRIISKLIEIFDIPKSAIPQLIGDVMPKLSQSEDSDDDDGNDENENSGGYGDGNKLFGSDDVIFHPTGENGGGYVKYGDVYDEYYKMIEELLLDGDVSEDTKKILIEYFKKLSDGSGT